MIKLSYENNGYSLKLIIAGDNKQEIIEQYYSLWNHGATEGDMYWLHEPYTAYLITDEVRLKKALVNASLFKILNENPDKYKNQKQGALLEARTTGNKIFDSMTQDEKILPKKKIFEPFIIQEPFESQEDMEYDLVVEND